MASRIIGVQRSTPTTVLNNFGTTGAIQSYLFTPNRILRGFRLKFLTGQLTIAGASNTAAALSPANFWAALKNVNLIVNSDQKWPGITGRDLYDMRVADARIPTSLPVLGDGATTNPSFVSGTGEPATIEVWLRPPACPESKYEFWGVDTRTATVELQLSISPANEVVAGASGWAVLPSIQVEELYEDPNYGVAVDPTKDVLNKAPTLRVPVYKAMTLNGLANNVVSAGTDYTEYQTNHPGLYPLSYHISDLGSSFSQDLSVADSQTAGLFSAATNAGLVGMSVKVGGQTVINRTTFGTTLANVWNESVKNYLTQRQAFASATGLPKCRYNESTRTNINAHASIDMTDRGDFTLYRGSNWGAEVLAQGKTSFEFKTGNTAAYLRIVGCFVDNVM